MDEKKIQHEYVMEFLCRSEEKGGLGYRAAANNIVSPDFFIPSLLGEFVQRSEPEMWKRLLRRFDNDESKLEEALKNQVKENFLKNQNVAIMFHQNGTINFLGEKVPLFYVSGTELNGDEDFEKNIFTVVEEASHTIQTIEKKKLKTIRPDVSFFVNGIFVGYMELKSNFKGQSAKKEGRGKVVKDYLETIAAYAQQEKLGKNIFSERRELFSIFEKGIHLTASDLHETYVMRGISSYFDMAYKAFSKTVPETIDRLAPELLKVFKDYPISSDQLDEQQRFEEVMRALYGKKMIEKEIRYYNVIQYRYAQDKDGKCRTSNTGQLIFPRPKQKFGCDKIMLRVGEMLDHEQDPDYYRNKLRRQLKDIGLPDDQIEIFVKKREFYCNNKYVYSLLMQYAAGFGKSNIIGWAALQLKDYRYGREYAYDKILLVVDRLQLRGQLDTTLMNMNIDKSMFKEAKDKPTFKKALEANERIIVVNIQKFNDLQETLGSGAARLKKMRVAFLVDEIHRSNSGEEHEQMIDLFDQLQDSFNRKPIAHQKKNLLIGFTATPTEENLARFGEFRSAFTIPFWVPFDSYPMKEAIADGYILDPTRHIIPFNVPVGFEQPADIDLDDMGEEETANVRESKEKVYAFEPRMRKIAEFVVDRLVTLVYGKIGGQGKAMLAVSSIPNAIRYFNILRPLYDKKCKEKLYARYKDAPIIIIYSDTQKHQSCSTLNDGINEGNAIQKFKQAKNGLIIVVDKLQTGFDEPKLHTLFLDKEIRDISAIQTISRVNRTCKGKDECHIVDCSWHNVNVKNIKAAFEKYCDMVTSNFNPEQEARDIAKQYEELCKSVVYRKWFIRYKKEKEDASFIVSKEGDVHKWIQKCFDDELETIAHNRELGLKEGDEGYEPPVNDARDLRQVVSDYANTLMDLHNVYEIDEKYNDATFKEFWQFYTNIYAKVAPKKAEGYELEVIDSSEVPGITMVETSGTIVDPPYDGPRGPWKPRKTRLHETKGQTVDEIVKMLEALNTRELLSATQARIWLREIGVMFTHFKNDENLRASLLDELFPMEDKQKSFNAALRKYSKDILPHRPDISNLDLFKALLKDNREQLCHLFVQQLSDVNKDKSDFDFDTTAGMAMASQGEGQSEMPFADFSELVKRMINPDYDEAELKQIIKTRFADRLLNIPEIQSIDTVVDALFVALNYTLTDSFEAVSIKIKNDLNRLFRAEQLDSDTRAKFLDNLAICFEGYLKKLYCLCHGNEYVGRDPNKNVTLMEIFLTFDSLRNLRSREEPEYRRLSDEFAILKDYRNREAAHANVNLSNDERELVLTATLDMYLYATGCVLDSLSNI